MRAGPLWPAFSRTGRPAASGPAFARVPRRWQMKMLVTRHRQAVRPVSNLLLLESLLLAAAALARAAGPASVGAFSNPTTASSVAGDVATAYLFLNIFILPTALLYLWVVGFFAGRGGHPRRARLRALALTPVGFPFAYIVAVGSVRDGRPLLVVGALAIPVLFALLMRLRAAGGGPGR